MNNLLERIIVKLIAFGYEREELLQMNPVELAQLLVTEQNLAAATHVEYEWRVTRQGRLYYAQKYNKAA
jgi:hypothetical protein